MNDKLVVLLSFAIATPVRPGISENSNPWSICQHSNVEKPFTAPRAVTLNLKDAVPGIESASATEESMLFFIVIINQAIGHEKSRIDEDLAWELERGEIISAYISIGV